jgi:hypothetical protein
MNPTKIALAIAVTSVMVAVAVAPILLSSALAAKTTTCTNVGGQEKSCTSSAAKCEETKAGEGQGGGEIKSSGCSVP